MKYAATALFALFTLAACTTTDEIIIDQKGVNMAAYQTDLTECKSYAASAGFHVPHLPGGPFQVLIGVKAHQ